MSKDSKNQNQSQQENQTVNSASTEATQSQIPSLSELAIKEAEEKKSEYEQKLKDLELKENQLKEKELELSQKESNALFGKEAKAPEQAEVIELNKDGKMIGNLDKEGKYPFDPTWNKGVVVRLVDVKKVDNDYVELPSTARLQVFEHSVYERLKATKGFEGKKVTVLHDYSLTIQI
jgi:hypothetical protein